VAADNDGLLADGHVCRRIDFSDVVACGAAAAVGSSPYYSKA